MRSIPIANTIQASVSVLLRSDGAVAIGVGRLWPDAAARCWMALSALAPSLRPGRRELVED